MRYEGLFNLEGKVALVVGAAGGLAGETCTGLAAFGATLAVADMSAGGLAQVTGMLKYRGIASWAQNVDVSDEASVSSLFDDLHRKLGRIDIMINFAGLAAPLHVEEIDAREFQKIVGVNLLGSFLLAKHSLQYMVPQGSGKIILLGSVQGQIGRPFSSHYSATKGGVHSMVRTLAVEVAKKNVQVNAVAPVFTLTPMSAPVVEDPEARERIVSTIPMGRLGVPEDLVGAMIFLSSRASDFITGQTLMVDGGCTIS
ncbi:MAG: SDR family oxidoreductase [Desulfobacteraceae bacterium]|nr:MAG: SDR family oxidoreductase [Desulfobacteraceae bacterium]